MVNDTRSKGCVRWGAIGPPPLQVTQHRLGAGARAPTAPTGCHWQGCRPPILASSPPCIPPLTQTCSQTLPLPLPPQARATAPRSPGSVLQSPSGLLHHTARVCTHSQPPGDPSSLSSSLELTVKAIQLGSSLGCSAEHAAPPCPHPGLAPFMSPALKGRWPVSGKGQV